MNKLYNDLIHWIETAKFWDAKYFRIHPQGYLTYKNDPNFVLFEDLKKKFDIKSNSQMYWMLKRGLFEKPKCPVCGKDIEFMKPYHVMNINPKDYVYQMYCSNKCNRNSESTKRKTLEAFSKQTEEQKKDIQRRKEETCLKNWGTKNPSQSEVIQQKMIKNCREKWGVDYTFQTENNKQKSRETCFEKYGVVNPGQSVELREKGKRTCLERYGVEHYINREKAKKTNLERYGSEHSLGSPMIREKGKRTCLERYGVETPLISPEIRKKSYDTRKANGNISKGEKYIINVLTEKFSSFDVDKHYQYKEERYPFWCDFYIPELDLFIEFQGAPEHGTEKYREPYDTENPDHVKQIEGMKSVIEKNPQSRYNSFIEWRTVKDPLKRKTAKENNLNWIEFWDLKEFDEWINSLDMPEIQD